MNLLQGKLGRWSKFLKQIGTASMILLFVAAMIMFAGTPRKAEAAAPTINTMSPYAGYANVKVTVNGSGFGATQGTSSVKFGPQVATITSWSDTKIVTKVPSGDNFFGGKEPVTVTVGGVTSNAVSFVVTHTTFDRIYKSSVDGAELRCSAYCPQTVVSSPYPLYVILHAFGGSGGVDGWMTADMPISWADQKGFIIVSPWGRNYQGMYSDGRDNGTPEPCIYDDFSTGYSGWPLGSGAPGWVYDTSNQCLKQQDTSDVVRTIVRDQSDGTDYTVSANIKRLDASTGDSSAYNCGGVMLRTQPDGQTYSVVLAEYSSSDRRVQIYRYTGDLSTSKIVSETSYNFDPTKTNKLKVIIYGDSMKVMVNDALVSTLGGKPDPSTGSFYIDTGPNRFTSGSSGLCTLGGSFQFDNYRVQNEFLYGETDAMDCIQQFCEELSDTGYRADPTKICLEGISMGGVGTYELGFHYPDVFAALHPSWGCTDVEKEYRWLTTNFPDREEGKGVSPPEGTWCEEQDNNISETLSALMGNMVDIDNPSPLVRSVVHENSAHYILENALNTPIRMEHQEYDSLIPNTTSGGMNIWAKYYASGKAIKTTNPIDTVQPDYANDQYLWNRWLAFPTLLKLPINPQTGYRQETSGLRDGPPADPNNIWDNTNYTGTGADGTVYNWFYGAHSPAPNFLDPSTWPKLEFVDQLANIGRLVGFFNGVTMDATKSPAYKALHTDPDEVAYKTYDNIHNRAWWLQMEIPNPDQDDPGLARVVRDKTNNKIQVHVKGVKTTTLDVKRMGLSTANGKKLTITLDNNTAPESIDPPLVDSLNQTDLKLVGEWYPKTTYTVTGGTGNGASTITGTTMTIPNVPTSGSGSTVTVTMPVSGQTNLLDAMVGPGFESTNRTNWVSGMDGGVAGPFGFEMNSVKAYAHSGSYSARIKDAKATTSPFRWMWKLNTTKVVSIQENTTYNLSAFVKTRSLNSNDRTFANGKYSPSSDSNVRIAIQWLNFSKVQIGSSSVSPALKDTNDWTPLQVQAKSPPGTKYANVFLYTNCWNNNGISGSVWFDDVALR